MASNSISPHTPMPPPQTPERGGCRAVAKPVTVLAVMVCLIALGFAIYLAMNPSVFVASVLVEQVGRTTLPDDQKQRIIAMVRDVEARYEAQELTREQTEAIGREIFTDPGINAALFYHVTRMAIERDGLAGDEAEAHLRLLQRLVRGIESGAIDGMLVNELGPVVADAGKPKGAGDIDASEYAAMIERVRAEVDAAEVPDEPYEVDAAAMFERAIERGEGA